MVLYSHVRCLERSDRSVPGCRRRGGRTLAHAHPEPRHFFLSGPGTTACLRRRLRGALYFVVHGVVF